MFRKEYPKRKDNSWNGKWINELAMAEYYESTYDFESLVHSLHCNIVDIITKEDKAFKNIKELYKKMEKVSESYEYEFSRLPKISNEVKVAFITKHPLLDKEMVKIKNKSVLLNENNPDIIMKDLSEHTRMGWIPTIYYKGWMRKVPYLIFYKKNFYICIKM